MSDFENMGILELCKTLGEMGEKMNDKIHPSLDSLLSDIARNYTVETILHHLADVIQQSPKCHCTCEHCMECKQ